jgi:hypothetical protein
VIPPLLSSRRLSQSEARFALPVFGRDGDPGSGIVPATVDRERPVRPSSTYDVLAAGRKRDAITLRAAKGLLGPPPFGMPRRRQGVVPTTILSAAGRGDQIRRQTIDVADRGVVFGVDQIDHTVQPTVEAVEPLQQ